MIMENSNLLQGLIDLFVELKIKDGKIKQYETEKTYENIEKYYKSNLTKDLEYLHKDDVNIHNQNQKIFPETCLDDKDYIKKDIYINNDAYTNVINFVLDLHLKYPRIKRNEIHDIFAEKYSISISKSENNFYKEDIKKNDPNILPEKYITIKELVDILLNYLIGACNTTDNAAFGRAFFSSLQKHELYSLIQDYEKDLIGKVITK
jgi:hypothetical protein